MRLASAWKLAAIKTMLKTKEMIFINYFL